MINAFSFNRRLRLHLLKPRFAICLLAPQTKIPNWAVKGAEFASVTKTAGGLSIVSPEENVPQGIVAENGWRLLEVEGPLPFEFTGILASVARPLANAGVAIFVVSTYDTDYVLVKEAMLRKAVRALRAAGHRVTSRPAASRV